MCHKSRIPKPPSSMGRHTLSQLTKECPPQASDLPCQRKSLMILLIFFRMVALTAIASISAPAWKKENAWQVRDAPL